MNKAQFEEENRKRKSNTSPLGKKQEKIQAVCSLFSSKGKFN